MSDLLQSGKFARGLHQGDGNLDRKHPNADQLNSFVEHTLPEHERLKTLAHLADCVVCREIVALSVPPLEHAAEVEQGTVVLPHFTASLAALFSGWNAAWVAVPVLAGLLILTFYIGHPPAKRPPTGQLADSRSPVAPPSHAGSESSEALSPRRPASVNSPESAASSKVAVKPNRVGDLPLQGRKPVTPRHLQVPVGRGGVVGPASAPGRASRSLGGPIVLQSRSAGMAPHTNAAAFPPSNRGANAFGLLQAPVRADAPFRQAVPSAAAPSIVNSPAPSPPSQPFVQNQAYVAGSGAVATAGSSAVTVNAQDMQSNVALVGSDVSDAVVDGDTSRRTSFTEIQKPLPSGLAVRSLAASLHRRLALDSRNQLFLSDDGGQHWESVRAAWRGRALTVAIVANGPVHSSVAPVAFSVPERYTRGAVAVPDPDPDSVTSVSGVVSDQSGAAIPGATIVASDSRTGFVRSVQTDSAGHYLVEELPPGVYQLEAQAPGFQRQSHIATVSEAQLAVKNLVLSVGQNSQSVTVEMSSAELQASSRAMPLAAAKAHNVAPIVPTPPVKGPLPVFILTTENGDRWTSVDGHTWQHE